MKRPFLKVFLWGAGIFGGLHLVIFLFVEINCIISKVYDGELIIILMDLPLYMLLEKFFSDKYFVFVSFVFGTLGYAIIGGLIFSILSGIVGFLFNPK